MVLEKKIDAMADGRPKAPLYLIGWLNTGCPNRSCSFNSFHSVLFLLLHDSMSKVCIRRQREPKCFLDNQENFAAGRLAKQGGYFSVAPAQCQLLSIN